jgi:type II secretory pathway pseudopilin PulG
MYPPKSREHRLGFTLAELLISLLILAEIATFTIPKVLYSSQNGQFKSVTKEDISVISAAYQNYALQQGYSANTKPSDLMQYINYVALDTSSNIDDVYTASTRTCSATYRCLRMHNGSMIFLDADSGSFGGTNTTNAFWMHIDPDGKVTDGTTNGPGKGVVIWVYYNGRITDWGSIDAGTRNANAASPASPSTVPPWFTW